MTGKAIILNGVSSAGKTTLAKSIQASADEAWLHIALDTFIAMLPDGRETEDEWFPVAEVEHDGEVLPRIINGPHGHVLLSSMHGLVGQLVRDGCNVVVDDVGDFSVIADYRQRLTGCKCLAIKVDAPLEELERRERERGDRLLGLAREQSAHLHEGIAYDLEVDTCAESAETLAQRILMTLEN